MPLTIDSTAALRGEKPKRKWTLIITSHGRWEYLTRALASLAPYQHLFSRRIFSFDGCLPGDYLTMEAPTVTTRTTGPERKGLAANLAQAWGALTPEDEWVFHVEEDFLIHDAPLDEMADTLDAYRHVANMVLPRNPATTPAEMRTGSMLRAQTYDLIDRDGWLEHAGGFWLNPMVANAQLLRSLTPSTEDKLTRQCRERGLRFGFWGGIDDPPRCTHIGVEGGMGSEGWLP